MASHNDFGKEAELLALNYLENKGYKILEQNYRYLKSEIDLIAEFEDQIIIIEVKARSSDVFIEPQQAVNRKKIKQILIGTTYYLEQLSQNKEVRFDIISVLKSAENSVQINHIKDAFTPLDAN